MWLFKPLSAHTAALSPYFAIAPYGLCVALFRYRSIRALYRPISLSLHTGSSYGYCLRQYASAVALLPRRQYAQLARLCARACALARIRRSKPRPPSPTTENALELFDVQHGGGYRGGRRVAPPHRRGKKIPQSILQLKMKRCHKLNRRLKLVMGVTFLYRVFSIVILVKYIKCNLILKINFQFQRQ